MTIDEKFEQIINVVLEHEGGYVNDPNDKGGETKFGISKRSYPNVDIKNLTLNDAKAIYKRDFWDNQPYKNIVDIKLATKVFDLSVNMGSSQANKLLQRALRATGQQVVEDGVLGIKTLAAVNQADSSDLLASLKSEAAGYYRVLVALKPEQSRFIQGWLTRAYASA